MGRLYNLRASSGAADWESGALYWSGETDYVNMVNHPELGKHEIVSFDASRVVPTASDNHPYSMYFVPLITY